MSTRVTHSAGSDQPAIVALDVLEKVRRPPFLVRRGTEVEQQQRRKRQPADVGIKSIRMQLIRHGIVL